jgi:hypothetical protein
LNISDDVENSDQITGIDIPALLPYHPVCVPFVLLPCAAEFRLAGKPGAKIFTSALEPIA